FCRAVRCGLLSTGSTPHLRPEPADRLSARHGRRLCRVGAFARGGWLALGVGRVRPPFRADLLARAITGVATDLSSLVTRLTRPERASKKGSDPLALPRYLPCLGTIPLPRPRGLTPF